VRFLQVEGRVSLRMRFDLRSLQVFQDCLVDGDKVGLDDEMFAILGGEEGYKRVKHSLMLFEDRKRMFVPFCKTQ